MASININVTKEVLPVCYAYTTPGISYKDGWTKLGYTERDAEIRVQEQTHTAGIKHIIHWIKNATYDGTNETFTDKEFHGYLAKLGVERKKGTEWFKISPKDAGEKFDDFRGNQNILKASVEPIPYKLRNEQLDAVNKTIRYFKNHRNGEFLWNAKPRFGKTLATYDLCMKMNFINILVVTNRPAIANSWYEDYEKFIGVNSGYYFVSHVDSLKNKAFVVNREEYNDLIKKGTDVKGCIEFVSLQDIKGSKYFGGDYSHDKLRELSGDKDENGKQIGITWDILIIDEAHEGVDTYKTDIAFEHINRENTLHLSGTPFKALARDKFSNDAIYNWTYADEQKAKRDWDKSSEEENPYENLPQLNLYTYQMSEIVKEKLSKGIEIDGKNYDYAFDLNEFFSTRESGKFVYDKDVDIFLDTLVTSEKFPFSTEELRNEIRHSFWILDRVDSAKELAKKLKEHEVFKDYKIILAAGDGKLNEEDETKKSYDMVVEAIGKYEKTITLSVGQLTTGITIPEWTGVLILSNIKSPSLYMQAAFRSQNPYLFNINGKSYRKENAYVFDFDPARSLTIFEEFANDLLSNTAGGRGDTEERKSNVKELLNFFPIYGEDKDGKMILLDAAKVLTIPRKIHAVEVVNRGFMSNFLFANINNIFSAPKEVKDIITKFEPTKEGKRVKEFDLDYDTIHDLNLNDENEVEISNEEIEYKAETLFGNKVYLEIENEVEAIEEDINEDLKAAESVSKSYTGILINKSKDIFGKDLKTSTKNSLEKEINKNIKTHINKAQTDWKIENNLDRSKREEELRNAKSSLDIEDINKKYEDKEKEALLKLKNKVIEIFKDEDIINENTKLIVSTVEKEKKEREKSEIEDSVRDHLRGFARTIPSFLMAYGNDNVTLDSFDKIVPDDVFKEVTSISLDDFRFLRDGGSFVEYNTGQTKMFEGQLFDEVVFNDSVKEFLNKKKELANYFDERIKGDIFDYIPPQQTNQIYTPKKVVKEMVNLLEKENPGCFDNPEKTFIDLYMKSGLYIAEIVKRLFRSENMKRIFPDKRERLKHIFENQVYGLAPTEIIYNIALNFILGFKDDMKIEKHNLRKLDSLKHINEGNLGEKLDDLFD